MRLLLSARLGLRGSWHRCSGCQTRVASMSTDPETTNKIAVEELTPAKPAPADTDSANPLRRAALIVVAVTILLFALSIVMERFTPSSSQAVVQAYVVRMAPEVAGRVIGVDVADNARVDAGQVLFRIDPRPFEIAVAEAQAQVEQIGQTLGASTAAVDFGTGAGREGGRRTRERSGPDGAGFRTCQTGRLPRLPRPIQPAPHRTPHGRC